MEMDGCSWIWIWDEIEESVDYFEIRVGLVRRSFLYKKSYKIRTDFTSYIDADINIDKCKYTFIHVQVCIYIYTLIPKERNSMA